MYSNAMSSRNPVMDSSSPSTTTTADASTGRRCRIRRQNSSHHERHTTKGRSTWSLHRPKDRQGIRSTEADALNTPLHGRLRACKLARFQHACLSCICACVALSATWVGKLHPTPTASCTTHPCCIPAASAGCCVDMLWFVSRSPTAAAAEAATRTLLSCPCSPGPLISSYTSIALIMNSSPTNATAAAAPDTTST
jgi:hypothetical protein